MTTQNDQKKEAALAALNEVQADDVVGVGTGTTVHYFIEALVSIKSKIKTTIASSIETENKLKALGFSVDNLNAVNQVNIYIDGADELNQFKYLIKGGGGALTREKILAAASKKFVCIADASKEVAVLGKFPVAIEVIPMARGFVARTILKLGGMPQYREGFVTDNGNIILDVYNLNLDNPIQLEEKINNIAGVVCNGIFAARCADKIIVGVNDGVRVI
ncbi:MAG: hypothetical protein ACD_29C00084G0004 [uncultured bacterium]|nr:MAG: hypothetical protein ACD_29C00084G0004 [uncultured bacterium]OGT40554.1 MAG: ribose 5-phosphate isomerase A [Gammaproteobacteria bacterium RIFCSPHIGHO2_12_FULL_38_14]